MLTALLKVPPVNIVAAAIKDPQKFVAESRKFLVALLAALAVLAVALSDGTITPAEWIQIGVAFVGALTTYQVSNG